MDCDREATYHYEVGGHRQDTWDRSAHREVQMGGSRLPKETVNATAKTFSVPHLPSS